MKDPTRNRLAIVMSHTSHASGLPLDDNEPRAVSATEPRNGRQLVRNICEPLRDRLGGGPEARTLHE